MMASFVQMHFHLPTTGMLPEEDGLYFTSSIFLLMCTFAACIPVLDWLFPRTTRFNPFQVYSFEIKWSISIIFNNTKIVNFTSPFPFYFFLLLIVFLLSVTQNVAKSKSS